MAVRDGCAHTSGQGKLTFHSQGYTLQSSKFPRIKMQLVFQSTETENFNRDQYKKKMNDVLDLK
jgi:hypothetical protein